MDGAEVVGAEASAVVGAEAGVGSGLHASEVYDLTGDSSDEEMRGPSSPGGATHADQLWEQAFAVPDVMPDVVVDVVPDVVAAHNLVQPPENRATASGILRFNLNSDSDDDVISSEEDERTADERLGEEELGDETDGGVEISPLASPLARRCPPST